MSIFDIEQLEKYLPYKCLAEAYIKIRKFKYGAYNDNSWVYGGIIGEIDDDMVLTSKLSNNGNSIYTLTHYWISKNHPDFDNTYHLYYSDKYLSEHLVTPELVQMIINDYKYILDL